MPQRLATTRTIYGVNRSVGGTRLSVLLARKAPVAIVFRRGPSKHVLLVRWNLSDDSFEAGQWLKGRVYERRCDLSEDGERLIYFAANYRARHPLQTWTAVSRPPYFTALALWQKGVPGEGADCFRLRTRSWSIIPLGVSCWRTVLRYQRM
jgi:hypothetical protein